MGQKILSTESMAKKYFGDEYPVGKSLEIEGNLATVKGVIQDIPHNSHFKFDFLFSFQFIDQISGYGTHWGAFNFVTYLQLHDKSNVEGVNRKITDVAREKKCPQVTDGGVQFRLQPLTKIHLDPRGNYREYADVGDVRLVYLFSVIALFILFIACVNFMNLSTARSVSRTKEVGMRKTFGAHRVQLVRQFFSESILLTFLAGLIAVGLTIAFLPEFNRLSGKQLSLNILNSGHFLELLTVVLITGIVAGSYPSFVLSGFRPVAVIKGIHRSRGKGSAFRRMLVIMQF